MPRKEVVPGSKTPTEALRLTLTPFVWHSLQAFQKIGDTEVSCWGIATDPKNPLRIDDIYIPKQEASPSFVEFDDQGLAHMNHVLITERELQPFQFNRVWIHTHPGNSPMPSGTDEDTFKGTLGNMDWAVMAILAQDWSSYGSYRAVNAQTGVTLRHPIQWEVDWADINSLDKFSMPTLREIYEAQVTRKTYRTTYHHTAHLPWHSMGGSYYRDHPLLDRHDGGPLPLEQATNHRPNTTLLLPQPRDEARPVNPLQESEWFYAPTTLHRQQIPHSPKAGGPWEDLVRVRATLQTTAFPTRKASPTGMAKFVLDQLQRFRKNKDSPTVGDCVRRAMNAEYQDVDLFFTPLLYADLYDLDDPSDEDKLRRLFHIDWCIHSQVHPHDGSCLTNTQVLVLIELRHRIIFRGLTLPDFSFIAKGDLKLFKETESDFDWALDHSQCVLAEYLDSPASGIGLKIDPEKAPDLFNPDSDGSGSDDEQVANLLSGS